MKKCSCYKAKTYPFDQQTPCSYGWIWKFVYIFIEFVASLNLYFLLVFAVIFRAKDMYVKNVYLYFARVLCFYQVFLALAALVSVSLAMPQFIPVGQVTSAWTGEVIQYDASGRDVNVSQTCTGVQLSLWIF